MNLLISLILSFTPVNDTLKLAVILDGTQLYRDSMCVSKIDVAPKWRAFYSWHFCSKSKAHRIVRLTDTIYVKNFDIDKYAISTTSTNEAALILLNSELPSASSKAPPAPSLPKNTTLYNSTGTTYRSGSSNSGCSSRQCSGYTKKGNRCGRMTTNCSGRCYQH